MKKKDAVLNASSRGPGTDEVAQLITELRSLIQSARHAAASTIDTLQVLTNFEIGRRIVEHEQRGERRAEYGSELLKLLSGRLTEEFGKGFSRSNLQLMRAFYLSWKDRTDLNCQTLSGNSNAREMMLRTGEEICQTPIGKSRNPFTRFLSLLTAQQ